MTCTSCGATIETTATTCPVCAAPVAVPAGVAAAAPAASTPHHDGRDQDGRDDGTPPSSGGQPGSGGYPPGGQPGSGGYPGGGQPGSGGYPGGGQPGSGGYPPAGPQWGSQPHPSGLPGDVRSWGVGAHLAGLGAALLTVAVFGFLGPLFVWLLKRDDHPFIAHHAKEALNFHLTVLVAMLGAGLLAIPAAIVGILTLGIGLVLFAGLVLAAIVAWFVLPVIGAVKAADGQGYRYPFTIRFVR